MKKGKQPELRTVEEEADESVVRLNVDGDEEILDEDVVEKLVAEGDDEIDYLFKEEKSGSDVIDEKELDKLFTEKKVSRHDNDEIQRALSQRKSSKASLLRMKSGEATTMTLAEQNVHRKTLEDTWEEAGENGHAIGPVFKIGLISIGVVLLSLGVFAVWKISQSDDSVLNEELTERQQKRDRLKEKSSVALRNVTAVEKLVKDYLQAETLDERIALIHHGEELREEIVAHEAENPFIKYDNIVTHYARPSDGHDQSIWSMLLSYGDYNESMEVYVHKLEDGEFKVDWPSLSGLQVNDIEKFAENQSTEGQVFRFLIEQKYERGFYNWGFNDKEYAVVRLSVPGVKQIYWGYIPLRNQSLLYKMNHYFEFAEAFEIDHEFERNFITLKVSFLPDTAKENHECFVIDELVSPSWVYDPSDDSDPEIKSDHEDENIEENVDRTN